jgi:lysophospholipase L1-like esterase
VFDNLHPNDAGYDKIAKLWYAAIADDQSTQRASVA